MKAIDSVGEYRTLLVRTEDSREFQGLTSFAQRVYYAIRMRLPLAGINTLFASELVPRCGIDASEPKVLDARDELIRAKLLDVDQHVWWLVRVLDEDPNLRWSDWKHRSAVQRRIATLPRTLIDRRFAQRYPLWLLDGSSKDGAKLDKRIKTLLDQGVDQSAILRTLTGKALARVSEDPSETSSSSSSSFSDREGGEEAPKLVALPSIERLLAAVPDVASWATGNIARHELLQRLARHVLDAPNARAEDVITYGQEIGAALSGMHGKRGRAVDAHSLELALRDYTTNRPPLNLRAFRAYLNGTTPLAIEKSDTPRRRTISGGE